MQELFDLPDQYDEMLKQGIGVTGNDKYFFIKGRLDLLVKRLPVDFKPNRILDFGCGTGSTSTEFLKLFPNASVVGSDISQASIDYASAKYLSENLSFISFDQLKKEEPFDIIYINCVLHHIVPNERRTCLELIFNLGHKDTLYWIFENNPANPGTQFAMFTNPFDKGVVKLWPIQLQKMMKYVGFQVVDTNYIFYFPQWLSIFRPLEKFLLKLPLGGQYGILGKKA